jgi:hypothetical protein
MHQFYSFNIELQLKHSAEVGEYWCGNAQDIQHFKCTGKPVEDGSFTGEC